MRVLNVVLVLLHLFWVAVAMAAKRRRKRTQQVTAEAEKEWAEHPEEAPHSRVAKRLEIRGRRKELKQEQKAKRAAGGGGGGGAHHGEEAEEEEVVTTHAFCNGCHVPITEERYRCVECTDFDLCPNCMHDHEHVHDARHHFSLIANPTQQHIAPQHLEEHRANLGPLPADWIQLADPSGRVYYANIVTKVTQWEWPGQH